MKLFRSQLQKLKMEFINNSKRMWLIALGAALISTVLGVLADWLLPWVSFGMILRSIILIPSAVSYFAVGYGLMLLYYNKRMGDSNWVPIRARFSPIWRVRLSVIVGALLLVMIYASNQQHIGYTAGSSLIAAFIISLFVFMRKTTQELKRETLGIPDPRDIAANAYKIKRANEMKLKLKQDDSKSGRSKEEARLAKAQKELEQAEAALEAKGRAEKK